MRKDPAARQTNRIPFMATDDLLAQIDAYRDEVRRATGATDFTRSQAIRALIEKGLDAMRAPVSPPADGVTS